MILPFVRDMLADATKPNAFSRAAAHLKGAKGRIRLSGLTNTAKPFLYAQLHHAIARPLILVVTSNRAAEELLPVLQSFCELTGAANPESVVYLPARDVLPFENLSPHPEIQEARAKALWRVASGAVSIVVAPFASSSILLREPAYYQDLGRLLRRGESVDLEPLVEHLNTVGYSRTDVVEMTGDYALRGGILDVFPPEAERPLRLELFGDEIETIRKFDPATQRSSASVEEGGAAAADRHSRLRTVARGDPRATVGAANQRDGGGAGGSGAAAPESRCFRAGSSTRRWPAHRKRFSITCPMPACWLTSRC